MRETFYTLIFVKNQTRVLLGFKKRGFGENTWNGYGGKFNDGERPAECAARELHEESNLEVRKECLKYLGVVVYSEVRRNTQRRVVYIFTASEVSGELQETEEMRPKWFELEHLPYEDMWPDSRYWLPLVLNDGCLFARFTYKSNNEISNYHVQELAEAPAYYPSTKL